MPTNTLPATSPASMHHPIWLTLARDIKLSHSVFALPFAILGTFLAADWADRLPTLGEVLLIGLCMVLARTAAMAFNRWADADLDARNPRTAGRALPAGRARARDYLGAVILCSGLLMLASAGFWLISNNPWPAIFSPLVIAWLLGYSWSKRFTWLCHVWLGIALALSPLAASLAIEPHYLFHLEPYLLALMVSGWVAGFDIIYALQDVTVDQREGLYSMPATLGSETALWISRLLHTGCVLALVGLVQLSTSLDLIFTLGILVVVALLIIEHALVWGSKTRHLPVAFLTVNGIISLLLGGLGLLDVLWL